MVFFSFVFCRATKEKKNADDPRTRKMKTGKGRQEEKNVSFLFLNRGLLLLHETGNEKKRKKSEIAISSEERGREQEEEVEVFRASLLLSLARALFVYLNTTLNSFSLSQAFFLLFPPMLVPLSHSSATAGLEADEAETEAAAEAFLPPLLPLPLPPTFFFLSSDEAPPPPPPFAICTPTHPTAAPTPSSVTTICSSCQSTSLDVDGAVEKSVRVHFGDRDDVVARADLLALDVQEGGEGDLEGVFGEVGRELEAVGHRGVAAVGGQGDDRPGGAQRGEVLKVHRKVGGRVEGARDEGDVGRGRSRVAEPDDYLDLHFFFWVE